MHVRSTAVTACVNWHQNSSTMGAVFVTHGSHRGRIGGSPLTWFQMLRSVLEFVKDLRLQSEYMEVQCGNRHPPMCLRWKEGLLKGVRELQAGAPHSLSVDTVRCHLIA